jgi:hypothetical protein
MTLADLANRTMLPLRQLRYALDHGLLRGGQRASRGRGSPRSLTEFEAFVIACAAQLLQAGLRQGVVRDCVALLGRYADKKARRVSDVPLYQAFQSGTPARLEVGDGANVRLFGSGPLPREKFDTGWRQIATGARIAGAYEPLVVLGVNVGALRRMVTG